MEYRVNIYIETSRHGPSKGPGKYMYLIEYILKNGNPYTVYSVENFENTFENELVLRAIIAAGKRLTKTCSIRVFTGCGYVFNSMNAGWPIHWRKNNWMKAGEKPVRNMELWKELLEVMEPHAVTYTKEEHSYRNWMLEQMKGE